MAGWIAVGVYAVLGVGLHVRHVMRTRNTEPRDVRPFIVNASPTLVLTAMNLSGTGIPQ